MIRQKWEKPPRTPKRSDGSFSNGTIQLIWDRDDGRCAWCGTPLIGPRGLYTWHAHHREPRGMGGTTAPHVSRPSNGVLLHAQCHLDGVENHRAEATKKGFLVSAHRVSRPEVVPIEHAVHGRVLLLDDGSVMAGPVVF